MLTCGDNEGVGELWKLLCTVCLFALGLTSGCRCGSEPFAQLTSVQGAVSRDHNESLNQWQPAAVGAEFAIGEAVKTASSSGAQVRFDDGAKLKLEESTTIRFLATKPDSGERGIDVVTGEATLTTNGASKLRTGIGLAVLEGGSTIRLTKTTRGLRFLVDVGLARLQGTDGQVTELKAGDEFEVGIGMAIVDRVDEAPAATASAAATATAPSLPMSGPIVANITGQGVQQQRPGEKRFTSLAEGEAVIEPGSKLRLKANNEVVVSRDGQSATLTGPGSYLIGGEGVDFVRPDIGGTVLEADGRDITLEVPGGSVTALGSQGRSRSEVSVDRKGKVTVRVRQGKLKADLHGNQALLSPGEGLIADKTSFSVTGRSLGYADISTQAGTGLMIHDPDPPTAVAVNFGELCPHLGMLELLDKKRVAATAIGRSSASLAFSSGKHGYQVRCLSEDGELSEPKTSGKITVYHDAGTAALAKSPPATGVNVDGRRYTVMYQNRLPSLTVRWPNAPKADSYTISIRGAGGSKQITSKQPVHTFQSGSILEGSHRVQFKASNGRVSRTTTVSIRFDNAAPKASITTPAPGSFSPGSTVHVTGIALPGWKVSVGGTSFPMDAQRRFSGQATAGKRGLVLRFEHEQRGVHHYLRRAAGIEP